MGFAFDQAGFIQDAAKDLDSLELKARSHQITRALSGYLPSTYQESIEILNSALLPINPNSDLKNITASEQGLAGWILMPISDYIGINGQSDIPLALEALKQTTQRFTSEFGIRHLLLTQPQSCLSIMATWLDHECHHVRRLISEGTRPLLPWAMQLPEFKTNPNWVLPLLEILKDDPSEYVRRSVANHINDISKSHPELVAEVSGRWLASMPQQKDLASNRHKTVKHACRTLIKAGDKKVLEHFGFQPNPPIEVSLSLSKDAINLGESVEMSCLLHNPTSEPQSIIIDYQVRHKRANGSQSAKVFKWKTLELGANEQVILKKMHPFKVITTRVYYEGTQGVDIQINGEIRASKNLELKMK